MSPARSYRLFALLSVASLLIWWRAIAATLALARKQDAHSHILIILPVSIALILIQWRGTPRPSIRWGSAWLGLSLLIAIAGFRWGRADLFSGDVRLALEILALVTWWIGCFVGCFGGLISRACLFPLLFLLWLIPIPEFALAYIISFLQQGTAWLARWLLVTVSVPVVQDGTTLTIPGLTVRVAEECSSIQSSMMLVVCSMVLSYLLLRSFWGRMVVTLAAIPLAIAKNAIRVFSLAVLAAYVDPGVLNSPLHRHGGPLYLALALACVSILIWCVRQAERRMARRHPPGMSLGFDIITPREPRSSCNSTLKAQEQP